MATMSARLITASKTLVRDRLDSLAYGLVEASAKPVYRLALRLVKRRSGYGELWLELAGFDLKDLRYDAQHSR